MLTGAPRRGHRIRQQFARMTTAPPASTIRSTRVRVRYAETDRMGVVYYANYFVWFEIGRTAWLRDTGTMPSAVTS